VNNPFVKLFINDLGKVYGLKESEIKLLVFIAEHMKQDNTFVLTTGLKVLACSSIGVKPKTLPDIFTGLCKCGRIIRLGTNYYLTDPYLLGYGDEKYVDFKRKKYSEIRLTMTYGISGRKEVLEVKENGKNYVSVGSGEFAHITDFPDLL
jgi:hypothetical protein